MRLGSLLLLSIFVGAALSSARADVIFSGAVSTSVSNGPGTPVQTCESSGAASDSISVSCFGNSNTTANVTGTGNPYGGSLAAAAFVVGDLNASAALGQLDLQDTYLLTGGTGPATLDVSIRSLRLGDLNYPFESCTLTFNGMSRACDLIEQDMSFAVQYWVPFSVDIDLIIEANAHSSNGEEINDTVTYALDGPGLVATPEPSSVLLLLPGLVGMGFAARSRAKG